jgi:hypothetical protein
VATFPFYDKEELRVIVADYCGKFLENREYFGEFQAKIGKILGCELLAKKDCLI